MGSKQSQLQSATLGSKCDSQEEHIQHILDASPMAHCKCSSEETRCLREIGEPPPLTRIDKRRPSSHSPESARAAHTASPAWRVYPEKRLSCDDVGWPTKKTYPFPHQIPLLAAAKSRNDKNIRSPVARHEDDDEYRMDTQQTVAARTELVGSSLQNDTSRLCSKISPNGRYYPMYGHPAMTIVPAICNSPDGFFPRQHASMNGRHTCDRLANQTYQPVYEADTAERRTRFTQAPCTIYEQETDPSDTTMARAGDQRGVGVPGVQWTCMRGAMQADLQPWLLTARYKFPTTNGVVPILAQPPAASPRPKSEDYLAHGPGMRMPLTRAESVITETGQPNGGQNGHTDKEKDLTTPEQEIDLPLKTLCNSVLVEGRASEDDLSTLTAILLQAIDLARQSADNRRGGNGGSHVISSSGSWDRVNGERGGDKQFAVPAVRGPVEVDDGITDDDATAFQALVQDDPTLRPLPEDEDQTNDQKMVYWCRSCRVTFKWRRHLEHHFLSHRTNERSSVCHICGKCFTRGDHLNRHASMHNLTEYGCQLCGQRFVRASHLEMHWESEHSRYIHNVPSVGRQTDGVSPTPLNALLAESGLHISSRHSQTNNYLYTRNHGNGDSLSDGSSSSPEHVNSYETPTGSPTEVMSGQTGRLNSRARSSPTNTENGAFEITEEEISALSTVPIGRGPRPYRCQVCARAFNRLAHLQRHHRVHLGEKPLRCSLCSRSYSTAEQLRSHVITQHDNNVINCQTCGKEFSTMGALTNHQKVHQREQNRAESALITRSFVQQ